MKRAFIFIVIVSGVLLSTNAQEEKYIGLFVYNFTKYFDWPTNVKQGNFTIQVLGHKSVYDELKKLTANKTVGTQQIELFHITSPDEVNPDVHILFLGHWQTRHLGTIKSKIAGKPVLLVSEFEGLISKGSVINFVIRDGKIKFQLNSAQAQKLGLKVDPRLRELAYEVID